MKRGRSPETVEQQVGRVAVELAATLAQDWPDHGSYDDLRGAVIYAFFAGITEEQGAFASALTTIEPRIPIGAWMVLRCRIASLLSSVRIDPYLFGCVHETLSGHHLDGGAVAPSEGRRKGGVHFTPADLADKVVRRTLEPLLAALAPTASVLDLRICDPAVGAGAFLVSLVRALAPRVLLLGDARDMDEAKRLVAIHCARGVDKCPFAVYATKLALRLECRAYRMPANWLDDNVRVGDALVGLDREQFVRFDWSRKAPAHPALERLWDDAVRASASGHHHRLALLAQQARSC